MFCLNIIFQYQIMKFFRIIINIFRSTNTIFSFLFLTSTEPYIRLSNFSTKAYLSYNLFNISKFEFIFTPYVKHFGLILQRKVSHILLYLKYSSAETLVIYSNYFFLLNEVSNLHIYHIFHKLTYIIF